MADRYYVNSPLSPGLVTLAGPEAHHLARVCRARPDDVICLFNGDGFEYPARVAEITQKHVVVDVTTRVSIVREHPFQLIVAAPMPKGDRGDFLVEKLTELGATKFVPLQTERSVVHPRTSRLENLQRAVVEASKQCGRNVLMHVEPLTTWTDLLACRDLPSARWIGDAAGTPLEYDGGDVAIAVGPEGGLTESEISAALAAGWRKASLGPRTLRVETAALAMAAICAIRA